VLVSPTEPPALRKIGTTSLRPETFGCDLLFAARGKWFGIQRKEFKDLIHSMQDGRLGQQVSMMAELEQAMVVVEGWQDARWTTEGMLSDRYAKVTRAQLRGLLWSVRDRGVWVDYTRDLTDTIALCQEWEAWCRKPAHKSLSTRPGPVGKWGRADNREWQEHLLQGLPGVGVELAGRILDEVGMPLGWRVSEGELLGVQGLGKGKVEKMMRAVPRIGETDA
jgi:ERCC4-type nuclease